MITTKCFPPTEAPVWFSGPGPWPLKWETNFTDYPPTVRFIGELTGGFAQTWFSPGNCPL